MSLDSPPLEVLIPTLLARMEQLRDERGFRIKAGKVRPIVKIAGERQIPQIVRPAVCFGDDVFDVEDGQRRVVLMQLAVFATVARPFPHARPGVRIHGFRPPWRSFPGPDA